MKLNTEQTTRAMGERILSAARKDLRRRNLVSDFEHGQWWITHLPSGAQWSAIDSNSINGFEFEQVTEGETI